MTQNSNSLREAALSRLREIDHYKEFSKDRLDKVVSRLFSCENVLLQNLIEWIRGEPLTDIWINDKYCVGAIMKIRRNNDFVSAFIALDDYAKDPNSEAAIWHRWC